MAARTDDDRSDPTDRALRDLLDAERHRASIEERRRRHWLRHQAADAAWAGA